MKEFLYLELKKTVNGKVKTNRYIFHEEKLMFDFEKMLWKHVPNIVSTKCYRDTKSYNGEVMESKLLLFNEIEKNLN